ncbi:MAG: pyruvate kinase [archaeon]
MEKNTETREKVIVTLGPYAPHLNDVLKHPIVEGIRLNTIMPLKETQEDLLKRLNKACIAEKKDLWIDLKGRQLRVASFGVPPFTEVKLSHKIDVYTPCKAYFGNRHEPVNLLEVDGDRLIFQAGPRRVIGPGESVTIPHPTLRIQGYLTDTDLKYVEAAKKVGLHKYMLSFVESQKDIADLLSLDKDAQILAKIESQKGIDFVKRDYIKEKNTGLMAARGDLYMELDWPHTILGALEEILMKDPKAVVASRILDSLAEKPEPECADMSDVDNLIRMGYNRMMLGDELCLEKRPVISALNVIQEIALQAKHYRMEKEDRGRREHGVFG